MFYGGSVSPPREPPRKKFAVPRRSPSTPPPDMTGTNSGASGSGSGHGVREGSLMWPMLTRANYAEWAVLMKCNFEILEVGRRSSPEVTR
jgi:hypothetical protein